MKTDAQVINQFYARMVYVMYRKEHAENILQHVLMITFNAQMINIRECAKSVGQSIQNPNTFFANYCGNYYGNWVKKKFFYNYWNARCYSEYVEEPVDKTIYDPCPPGYTVPGYGVFSELIRDKWDKGRSYGIFIKCYIF